MTAMKRVYSFLMLSAVAAMAFTSCQKNEIENSITPGPVKITVTASVDNLGYDTKTYLGDFSGVANTVLWGKDEQMTIAVNGASLVTANSSVTSDFDGKNQATFSFELTPDGSAPYTYSGVYPSSAVIDGNKDFEKFKVNLLNTQNATASSYDPSAYIMVAKAEEFSDVKTTWMASYRRATALNKITLKGLAESIIKVEVTAPTNKYLAGRRNINLSDGTSGDIYNSGTETITIKYATPLAGGSDMDVWFTSWGQTINSGEKLIIKAYSDAKTYTRTITANSSGITFAEGCLNKLSINMATDDVVIEGQESYAGQYLIGAYVGEKWYLMSSANGGNFYSSVSTGVTSSIASVTSFDFSNVDDIKDMTWTVATVGNGYSIKSDYSNKYVALNSNSNYANASESAEALDVTINNKLGSVKSNTYAGRALKYNSANPRFAFYTTAQNDIYFIPFEGVNDPDPQEEIINESTLDDPYTPAEANALAVKLGSKTLDDVYVAGIVSQVSVSTEFGNADYYISADGTETDAFFVYRGKYIDGAAFTSTDQLKVGDKVTVCGTLKLYNNTPEFNSGSSIVKYEAATPAQKYSITVNASENGTVTASATEATAGTEITLTVTPATGYVLEAISVVDASSNTVAVSNNKFTMPESNVTVSATFKEIPAGVMTATIKFGTNNVKINSASVTGKDDQDNTWTITTEGTTSFTANTEYYQVGSSSKPASSITFTTTLPETVTKVDNLSIKLGGFSGTAGDVTLKVGDATVGTGNLNATNDVTVSSTSSADGRTITITVSNISKGVKVYNITAEYE